MSDTEDSYGSPDDRIIRRAQRRFKRCQQWEAVARQRWLADWKFYHGDAYNGFQWPDSISNEYSSNERPMLTINKARTLCLNIINEAKQNKAAVKYRPLGNDATKEASDIFEGVARHIQNISQAQNAQGQAIEQQVASGLGWTRVVTNYVDDQSFDQEIYILGIPDATSVYLDPDAQKRDGSDARYGFVFTDRPRDEVEEEYPETKFLGTTQNVISEDDVADWIKEDTIRVAEYYEIEEKADELIGTPDGQTVFLRSELGRQLRSAWLAEAEARGEPLQRRDVVTKRLKWYKIVGDKIVDRTEPPGKTIPLVPWIGEQVIIDGILDRKGHIRALIDAQRMLNYNRSSAVEFGALQGKSPWLVPDATIEGYETYYASANAVNHAYLPYRYRDDDGQPIPPPERAPLPQSAPAYLDGAQAAERDMMLASGQHEADLGEQGNERSGKAINERQRAGDRATYHFIDNQAIAIRRQGEILLELIPEIYDTQRMVRLLGEDQTESTVQVDPQMPAAATFDAKQKILKFNPTIGRYEVVSDVGPDYATQRQEAFNAVVQILTQAPQLINVIGDLLFKVADFPLADQIAERLKPGLQPEAQVAIAELQKQLQKSNQQLGEAMQALAEERIKSKNDHAKAAVDAFDADTRRLAVVKDMAKDGETGAMPPEMQAMVKRLVQEVIAQNMQDDLGPVEGATAATLNQEAHGTPPQGAMPNAPMEVSDPGRAMIMQGGA